MIQRTYILVFRENFGTGTDAMKAIADALNEGERLFRFDENVGFLQTTQDIEMLMERLRSGPLGKTFFFMADITDASRAGNMVPIFWDILHQQDNLSTAA